MRDAIRMAGINNQGRHHHRCQNMASDFSSPQSNVLENI
jgi:hypothetical protein